MDRPNRSVRSYRDSSTARKPTTKPTAIDLFSGCGGLTVGLKRAGFDVIGAVEIDKLAASAYEANHPDVHLWTEDIRTLTPFEVMATLEFASGSLDLLAGCPPCQGFSSIRTLNGARTVAEPRNDLIRQFTMFIEVLRPKAVMFENVPALAHDSRMQELKDTLTRLDYRFVDATLDAAAYGVPQRRRRLVLIARHNAPVAFGRPARKARTVRTTIEHLPEPGTSGDPLHDRLAKHSERIQKLIAAIPKNGGSRSALPPDQQLACHADFDGFKDVYGRMAWETVSPTITGGCWNPSKGRFLHPVNDRAITLREAALLQTFPRKYKFPEQAGKSALGEMIGNALPPEFVYRHAKALLRSLAESEVD